MYHHYDSLSLYALVKGFVKETSVKIKFALYLGNILLIFFYWEMLRIVPAGKSSCWVVPFPMILSYYYDVKIHLLFLPDLRCWELFWISFPVVPFPMIPSTRSCGGNRIQIWDHCASWLGFLHHNQRNSCSRIRKIHVTELEKYLFQNMEGTE